MVLRASFLPRVAVLSLLVFVFGGCSGAGSGADDSDAAGAGGSSNEPRAGSGSGGHSQGGGSTGASGPAEECTRYHCDCSYCDFNPDYRCVDLCEQSCGNKDIGFHCDGGSECIYVATDNRHCGSCDNACATGEQCIAGVCATPEPAPGGTGGSGAGGASGGNGGNAGSAGTAGASSGGSSAGTAGASSGGSSAGTAGSSSGGSGSGGTSGGHGGNAGSAGTAGSSSAGSGAGGAAATDPCAGVTQVFEGGALGYFCGANLPLSICTPGSTPGTTTCSTPPVERLYLCSAGKTVGYVTCAAGCHASAAGEPDYCLDEDPCANSPFNDASCGTNLSPLAEPDVLYTCQDQVTVASEVCGGGCSAAPLGLADQCAPVEQGSD